MIVMETAHVIVTSGGKSHDTQIVQIFKGRLGNVFETFLECSDVP